MFLANKHFRQFFFLFLCHNKPIAAIPSEKRWLYNAFNYANCKFLPFYLQLKICRRPRVENEAELGDSMEVETLKKNLTIEQSQVKAESLHNPAGQIKIRAKGTYNLPLV